MGTESLKPANTPTEAVFLSCASLNAEAAQRICAALRAAVVTASRWNSERWPSQPVL